MLTSVFFMYLISVLHGSMSSELELKKTFSQITCVCMVTSLLSHIRRDINKRSRFD